ncbi:MAG: response regulator [Rhodocyclales bacterium GT-UBC]|nr:MAG: response regulator [Rhodocyclales bacterium GT-UBC]
MRLDFITRSVRRRITWVFGLFVALSMVSVALTVGFRLHTEVTSNLNRELQEKARQDSRLLLQRLDYLLEIANALVKSPLVINGLNDVEGRENALPDLIRNFREGRDVHAVALLGFDGKPVYSSLEALPTYEDSTELRSALANGVTSYLIDAQKGHWVVFVPVSYYSTTQGALVVVYDLGAVAKRVLPADPVFGVRLLAGDHLLYEGQADNVSDLLIARQSLAEVGQGVFSGLKLQLEVSAARQHYLAPARSALGDVAILGLVLTLAAIAIAYRIGFSISRPIILLRQRVAAADGSPENYCAPLGTRDELEELAEMFDRRTHALRDIQIHLEDLVGERTRELEAAKEMAEEASRFKSSFLANMSHEIRTPMNAIVGLTHLLLRNTTEPQQIGRLEKISQAAQHLLSVINDILDFSKIEAGKLTIEKTDFDLDRVFQNLNNLVSERAAEKQLEVINRIDPALPAVLHGDPMRLGQVLLNFASNAVKFTESGSVIFRARLVGENADGLRVRFEVSDTGIGLSEAQCSVLFQAFVQADASTTRKYGGTGLGLAISKRLVDLMGGQVGVDSRLGEGSTFWFELPLQRAAGERLNGRALTLTEGLRVLVVDDNGDARTALEDMLHSFSARVVSAESGEQALQQVAAARENGVPFDLVLMDWAMPGMDGIETSRRIHEFDAFPRIILATAYGRDWDGEMLRSVGIVGQLSKPLTPSTLYDAMAGVFSGAHSSSSAAKAGEPVAHLDLAALHGRRVLLAEDNPVNQEVALALLVEEGGLIVDVANDGVEVLAKAAEVAYDLILMDVQMPNLDGVAATRALRQMPAYVAVPILAMTANAFDEDRRVCLEAGMNDHVAKPVDPERLFEALLRWMPASPARPARPRLAPSPLPGAAELEEWRALLAGIEGIDLVRAQAMVRGRLPAYRRLLGIYTRSNEGEVGRIRQLLLEGQFEEARRHVHSLKGASASLGLVRIQELAMAVEQSLKSEGADARSQALEALVVLENELPGLIARLQSVAEA